jgi:hypothetical protein
VTNSVLAERHVVGVPTIQHLPPGVHSLDAAVEAIEWGECYGILLDADQQATLRAGLGERRDGSWAASEVADFKGRQAGKNDTVKVRQGAGIDLFGERLIVHTAHEFATANEDFLRLVAIYEAFDDLRKQVQRIRYANGEQGIEFLSGARIKYRARTGGAGRGFAEVDLVIYDEAQHLQPEHLGASFPTMLANPNFQAWFCGSGGFASSVLAWRLRRRALLGGGGRFAYTENTAQIITVHDDGKITLDAPLDLLDENVLLTHPGYAHGRVSRETMTTMHAALGAALFGREILNLWEPEPVSEADGPLAAWADLADPASTIASHRSWALAVSPIEDGQQWASIGVAGRRVDGLLHVEWRDHRPGTGWVVARCVEAYKVLQIPLRVRRTAPEGALIADLIEAGVPIAEVSATDEAQSCGAFIAAAVGTPASDGQEAVPPSLRHLGQPSLTLAVRSAVLRSGVDGAVVWSARKSSVEITPLQAVTVAVGGVPAAVEPWLFA